MRMYRAFSPKEGLWRHGAGQFGEDSVLDSPFLSLSGAALASLPLTRAQASSSICGHCITVRRSGTGQTSSCLVSPSSVLLPSHTASLPSVRQCPIPVFPLLSFLPENTWLQPHEPVDSPILP